MIESLHHCFGHWILEFEIYLLFGACDLGFKPLVLVICDLDSLV